MEPYLIITDSAEGYYEEKRSRFLAVLVPVQSEAQALDMISRRRKQYSDARHHCYAFVCGARHELVRFSDDGEPSGTAGRPILDMLLGSGIHNALLLVTRYFGGTLLGTGGLVRAYQAAAADAIAHAPVTWLYQGGLWELDMSYHQYPKIQRLILQKNYPLFSEVFEEKVRLSLGLLPHQEESFVQALSDLTAGEEKAVRKGDVFYTVEGNKAIPQEMAATL